MSSISFSQLQKDIQSCRYCQERFGFEPHPVVSGNETAKIIQISQAPSRSVHESRKSFADASGKKLRQEWYHISDDDFYNPDYFYLTSVAHCYPGKSPSGGDRIPPKCCANKWLIQEIKAVQNELFLIIGGKAAAFFFPHQDFSTLIFQNQQIDGKPAYVLPHPSPSNQKWFLDHPAFLKERVQEIAVAIHKTLGIV